MRKGFEIIKEGELWGLKSTEHPDFSTFYLDFTKSSYHNIFSKGVPKQSPLAKAIGIKTGKKRIVDATAGWLKDTWMFLNLGCEVIALEENTVVYELDKNSVEVAAKNPKYSELFSKLELLNTEACDYFDQSDLSDVDVIYLDPMFPESSKTALAGKEMQILQALVTKSTNPKQILTKALQTPVKRVVVKRPLKGDALEEGVHFSIKGKASRFDVYLNA